MMKSEEALKILKKLNNSQLDELVIDLGLDSSLLPSHTMPKEIRVAEILKIITKENGLNSDLLENYSKRYQEIIKFKPFEKEVLSKKKSNTVKIDFNVTSPEHDFGCVIKATELSSSNSILWRLVLYVMGFIVIIIFIFLL